MFILPQSLLNPLIWNLNLIHISGRRLLRAGMAVSKVSTATTYIATILYCRFVFELLSILILSSPLYRTQNPSITKTLAHWSRLRDITRKIIKQKMYKYCLYITANGNFLSLSQFLYFKTFVQRKKARLYSSVSLHLRFFFTLQHPPLKKV